MSLPTPKIGDTNVRGYILTPTDTYDVSALQSLYGWYPADVYNPLQFWQPGGVTLAPLTEVYFDVVANPKYNPNIPTSPTAFAANVRRA
jgi:hypothetical protein